MVFCWLLTLICFQDRMWEGDQMSDSKYKNLLRGEFESLGYFADEYYAITGRHERFEFLVKKIWPCIQKLSIFPKWVKQARSINRKSDQIRTRFKKEIQDTFESLKEKLTNGNLETDSTKQQINTIEKAIESRVAPCQTYELIHNLIKH